MKVFSFTYFPFSNLLIFNSIGIQKFIFPATVGTRKFEKISFDNPKFWAHFTGSLEILCGHWSFNNKVFNIS